MKNEHRERVQLNVKCYIIVLLFHALEENNLTNKKQLKTQNTMNHYIMHIAKNKQPETVEHLIKLVQQKFSATQNEIMEQIIHLQKQGKLMFKDRSAPPPTIKNHLFSSQAVWFWIITALALTSAATAFTISENASSIVYVRYVLGSVFVLYLPGYSLIRALFPQKELGDIERIALSIVMSLTIVTITAFALNYTPWGIKLVPVTFSLLALTITFSIAAVIREHKTQLNRTKL